jgi:hypothetical protein
MAIAITMEQIPKVVPVIKVIRVENATSRKHPRPDENGEPFSTENKQRYPHRTQQRHNARSRRRGVSNNKSNQKDRGENKRKPLDSSIDAPSCSVCRQVDHPKYKCPKCRATYCSILCCRRHKDGLCEATKATIIETPNSKTLATTGVTSKYLTNDNVPMPLLSATASSASQRRKDEDALDEGWKIDSTMTHAMQSSLWLRQELQDSGLRALITRIVNSSNTLDRDLHTAQERALQQAKDDHPMFQRFIDKLLVLSGVLERQREDSETTLETWLQQNNDGQHPLVLKALPRRIRHETTSSEKSSTVDDSSDGTTSESSDTSDGDESVA